VASLLVYDDDGTVPALGTYIGTRRRRRHAGGVWLWDFAKLTELRVGCVTFELNDLEQYEDVVAPTQPAGGAR
jgi:hypothetical protein